ncbi:MAG: hypothetical protein ACK5EA_06800, partial [Planctomycetaceae bacterium]
MLNPLFGDFIDRGVMDGPAKRKSTVPALEESVPTLFAKDSTPVTPGTRLRPPDSSDSTTRRSPEEKAEHVRNNAEIAFHCNER